MMVSHLVDRTPPANLRSLLPLLQGSCFVLIETARFAATSLLIVLGLPLALFLFGLAGVGVTIWPNVVPPGLTIWDAAAPERSQVFMLIGVGITMPLIIAYTAWAYWVFRGKVGDEGYH